MTIQELRQLTPKKLWAQLQKTRRELATTKFHIQTGQAQDTHNIKRLRRFVARIQTLLHNKVQ